MPNLSGQSIGRYHILEQLGEGGMATVYKAYDTRLERDVAVKVLRTDQFIPAELHTVLQRFEREAKSLAKLSHPNIVNILDFGEHEEKPFLVMEYLPGGTLKQRLGQAIPWQETFRTLLPVARGLAYAHQHNLIHRDVKPANILMDEFDAPILTDFGIAKLLADTGGHTLTGSGVGIGTPEYMAPEQGMGASTIDARADIYSLGIVLYEMVVGRKPYIADTPMAVVLKQMINPLPRPADFVPDLPEGVEHILFKALAKQPEDRYADMNALIAAMEGLLAGASKAEAQAVPVPSKRAKKKAAPRARPSNMVIRAILGTLGMIVILVLGIMIAPKIGGYFNLASTNTLQPTKTETSTPSHTARPTTTPTLVIKTQMSPKDSMIMVYVPAGEFAMGSDSGNNDERPVHTVRLDSFWIDQTEITNKMYSLCVSAGACEAPKQFNSYYQSSYYGNNEFENYPVIYVDWYMAQTYCTWAERRLPTEAEWEKAARGPANYTYPWGEGLDCDKVNAAGCKRDTTPVGEYEIGKSPYGVYDMAGNVMEWVADWYSNTYYESSPRENPSGPLSGEYHVLRGGSWTSIENSLRSSYRLALTPNTTNFYLIGFRCAKSASP